jgi:hypothetical protein
MLRADQFLDAVKRQRVGSTANAHRRFSLSINDTPCAKVLGSREACARALSRRLDATWSEAREVDATTLARTRRTIRVLERRGLMRARVWFFLHTP